MNIYIYWEKKFPEKKIIYFSFIVRLKIKSIGKNNYKNRIFLCIVIFLETNLIIVINLKINNKFILTMLYLFSYIY